MATNNNTAVVVVGTRKYARKTNEYNESHVVTSKKAPRTPDGEFLVPYDSELECKLHVVVLDNNTRTLKENSPAIACGRVMSAMGSKNPVKILRGGYEDFSALYPFLRTQKIIYMPRELDALKTYPIEILPGQLYLGNYQQGCDAGIQKDLKIKAHVNVSNEDDTFFVDESTGDVFNLPAKDEDDANIFPYLPYVCQFISTKLEENKPVLVFSKLGISRCVSIVLAYLMNFYKWTLQDAYTHVGDCKHNIRPHRTFVKQLSEWEESLFGERPTDIENPNY
ncbi:serine/threonine/tyrosine-interacting-like protein 1 isoform X2 [Anneissia japonica]|uniref:serine/threonine/tyrosine-interacting-like protein 1 isoform X2 n=1 Tax=Anneissia japonica TaxID=1529436 RepID=UPI0014257712|nr:serine/threonine/tyrosine-interacting-like protein 1 isoform X2 [Anneissia japonica]